MSLHVVGQIVTKDIMNSEFLTL